MEGTDIILFIAYRVCLTFFYQVLKAIKVSKQNLPTLNARRCFEKYSNSKLTLQLLYVFLFYINTEQKLLCSS